MVDEYNRTSTNNNVEERIMTHTQWMLLDPKTKAKAQLRPELKQGVRTYKAIREYLE